MSSIETRSYRWKLLYLALSWREVVIGKSITGDEGLTEIVRLAKQFKGLLDAASGERRNKDIPKGPIKRWFAPGLSDAARSTASAAQAPQLYVSFARDTINLGASKLPGALQREIRPGGDVTGGAPVDRLLSVALDALAAPLLDVRPMIDGRPILATALDRALGEGGNPTGLSVSGVGSGHEAGSTPANPKPPREWHSDLFDRALVTPEARPMLLDSVVTSIVAREEGLFIVEAPAASVGRRTFLCHLAQRLATRSGGVVLLLADEHRDEGEMSASLAAQLGAHTEIGVRPRFALSQHGPDGVIAIIDAGSDLGVAFARRIVDGGPPCGVRVLVACLGGDDPHGWLELADRRWTLGPAERDAAPELTGVPDDDRDGREFNDRAFVATAGWPFALQVLRSHVLRNHGRTAGLDVAALGRSPLDSLLHIWTAQGPVGVETLAFLSVLPSGVRAPVGVLLRWLARRELHLTRARLLGLLTGPLSGLVFGVRENALRIEPEVFAKHAREQFFSAQEWADRLPALLRALWDSTDPNEPVGAIFEAVSASMESGQSLGEFVTADVAVERAQQEFLAEASPPRLIEAALYRRIRLRKFDPVALARLQRAANPPHDDPLAMCVVGEVLLEADHRSEDGWRWIRRAADAGLAEAAATAHRQDLVDLVGDDRAEAARALAELADTGCEVALIHWGMMFDDAGDRDSSLQVLEHLAEQNPQWRVGHALALMSERGHDPDSWQQGWSNLRACADEGDDGAVTLVLCLRRGTARGSPLLDLAKSSGAPVGPAEIWFMRLVAAAKPPPADEEDELAFARARLDTVERLHDRALVANIILQLTSDDLERSKAASILRAAARDVNTRPHFGPELAALLIEGAVLPRHPGEVEELLRALVSEGLPFACLLLAMELAAGRATARRPDEDESLLRRAHDAGLATATLWLVGGLLNEELAWHDEAKARSVLADLFRAAPVRFDEFSRLDPMPVSVALAAIAVVKEQGGNTMLEERFAANVLLCMPKPPGFALMHVARATSPTDEA